MIAPDQIKAGRQQLCWTRTRLAEKAGIGTESVRRAEKGNGELHVQPVTFAKIRKALEIAGVDFAVRSRPSGFGQGSRGGASSRAIGSQE